MLTGICKYLPCQYFISDTGGDRCTALLCPHEDKPVYEEAMDSIDRLKAALAAERLAREKAEKKAEIISHSSLGNNLCPDHRDKQAGKPCLACEIDRLNKRADEIAEKELRVFERYEKEIAALKAEGEGVRGFITPIEGECWIGKNHPVDAGRKWDQCCCQCKYLLIDHWHCLRMPEELKEAGHCGCEKIRGYICTAGEIHEGKSGHSGWPHHSIGCECFTKRQAGKE